MKRYLAILIAVLGACLGSAFAGVYSVDQIPNGQLADSTRLVSNPDGILSPQAESSINAMLRNIRSNTTAHVVLVAVDDIDSGDIDDFATRLFGAWGRGHSDKDNGLLILVAKDSHRYVFRTGYGLEGVLPDVVLARIGRHTMAPAFKAGNYDAGMEQAVSQIEGYLTDPDVRAEIASGQKGYGNEKPGSEFRDIFMGYLTFSIVVALVMALVALYKLYTLRGKDRYQKYCALVTFTKIALLTAIFTLGLTLLVGIPL